MKFMIYTVLALACLVGAGGFLGCAEKHHDHDRDQGYACRSHCSRCDGVCVRDNNHSGKHRDAAGHEW